MKSDIDNLPEILVTDASRESHPMHRPTLHGERILLNRDWGKIRRPTITNDDWNDLQKIINLTLPDETRQRIEQYLHIYGGIGSFYSPENTVLVSEILPALERWIPVAPASAASRFSPSPALWHVLAESGKMDGSSEPPADRETGRPGRHGEQYARRHHGPSRNIDRP